MTNHETDLIHAPWSAEQVTALNAFQHHGRMHPFTCGATHASGQSPVLVAIHSGWVCPDPQCVYRQDWAHAFMAEGVPARIVTVPPPAAVSVPPPAPRADDQAALHDRIADAVIPLLLDTLPKVIARSRGCEVADAVLAVLPEPADRAAVRAAAFDEAAEKLAGLDPVKAALAGQHAWNDAAGIVRHMARQERRMATGEQPPGGPCVAGEQQNETPEATPCSVPNPCDPDDGPCDRHEREQSHAENDHSVCRRDECEVLRQS